MADNLELARIISRLMKRNLVNEETKSVIPKLHYIQNPVTLSNHARTLIQQHGGVRPAARAIEIDPGYLVRLRNGSKSEPSDSILRRMGLKKHVHYTVMKGLNGTASD